MKLKQQVCSLGLSRKLKELGVRQESVFGWWKHKTIKGNLVVETVWHDGWERLCAAFTVAELGEILPKSIQHQNKEWFLRVTCDLNAMNYWRHYGYESEEGLLQDDIESDTEANARAKMLVYLLENKLVTAEEVNGRTAA